MDIIFPSFCIYTVTAGNVLLLCLNAYLLHFMNKKKKLLGKEMLGNVRGSVCSERPIRLQMRQRL